MCCGSHSEHIRNLYTGLYTGQQCNNVFKTNEILTIPGLYTGQQCTNVFKTNEILTIPPGRREVWSVWSVGLVGIKGSEI